MMHTPPSLLLPRALGPRNFMKDRRLRWGTLQPANRPEGRGSSTLLGWAFRPRNFMKNPPRRINWEQRANIRRGFSPLSTLASLYLTAAAIALATAPPTRAQSPTAAPPSFDAASIKPADPEHIGLQMYSPNPGSFRAMAADIKHLIAFAYNVRDVQVSGGPRWADTELFDIEANASSPAAIAELRLMVQLNGRGANMSGLASVLSSRVGNQVIDRTELAGFYNFTLTFTPDDAAATEIGPSIFTALQEQLGLKLEPAKGTVEILVIDGVDRPSGN
jgi:hypothetical protein